MRKFILTFCIFSVLSNSAMAECPNAIRLKVGDTVKDCERIGLSLDYDLDVRKDLVEGDFNKKIIEEQAKLLLIKDNTIKTSQEQVDIWKADSLRERAALDKERSRSNLGFWLGIAAGIVLTVGAGYAMGQAAGR